jgi:hypothetical protein
VRLPARRTFRLPRGWPWQWLRPRSKKGRHRLAIGVAFVLLLLLGWCSRGDGRTTWDRRAILDAIRWVESRDRDAVPDGDGGLAIGPYQIHEVYWRDALRSEPSLGGTYQDCRRRAYAEKVVAAYMRLHVPDAWERGDGETIARVHNGGPRGAGKNATLGYWQRVRARLP